MRPRQRPAGDLLAAVKIGTLCGSPISATLGAVLLLSFLDGKSNDAVSDGNG